MSRSSLATPTPRHAASVTAPFGAVGIWLQGASVAELRFLPPGTPAQAPDCALAAQVADQLARWFDAPRSARFDLPLAQRGTAFQQRVWQAIAAIPPARVRTYGALAAELGSAARAVGQACGANPFPIIVPCHRVVSSSGLGGFANATSGHLTDTKQWLLSFEAAH